MSQYANRTSKSSARARGAQGSAAQRPRDFAPRGKIPDLMQSPRVELVRTKDLKPFLRNARKHSDRQVGLVAASIEQFGFLVPILIDAEGVILCGHCRWEAAKRLGHEHVPALRIEHLSETEKRAFAIAENRLGELAGWNEEVLADELRHLSELDLSFDLSILGFDTPELDVLLEPKDRAGDVADELPPTSAEPPVSSVGDLWQLGPHRLICADSRERSSYDQLLGEEQVGLVFTDPPYNCKVRGNVSRRAVHDEFVMASGDMTDGQFEEFLVTCFANLASVSANGATHFVCIDWRQVELALRAGRRVYSALMNLCVWVKDRAGMGSQYRSGHELVLVFKAGHGKHVNNVQLGRHGRYRTNVWQYGLRRGGGNADRDDHPTIKPVALVGDAIMDCSKRGDIILDAFGGSGTTIIAAERTGRVARAIELDPKYVDVAVRRWQAFSGAAATLTETGETFEQVTLRRTNGAASNVRVRRRPA